MPVTSIAGKEVHVNDEGFLTEFDEWDEEVGAALASNLGIEMTPRHWEVINFLRADS